MEYETGYKVVARSSCHSVIARGAAMVKYIPNTWVVPPEWLARRGYYLTYFNSKLAAVDFIISTNTLKYMVWECFIRGKVEAWDLPPRLDTNDIFFKHVTGFYRHRGVWPTGTMMAQSIMLYRNITPEIMVAVADSPRPLFR